MTEAVHRLIVADQYEEVAFDRRVHETFTELSMKRASVGGIVDAAAGSSTSPSCWRISPTGRWRVGARSAAADAARRLGAAVPVRDDGGDTGR